MKKRLSLLLLLAATVQLQAQQVSKDKQIANLESFAKLYGYVRYFHPSEEAAAVNWDNFLYYGNKEVENATNTQVLNQKLNALFNPIAPSVYIVSTAAAKDFDVKSITPPNKQDLKEITWQHYGMGNQDGLYKSIRTNRPIKIRDPKRARFAVATSFVDATAYRGKKFRLRGWMKTEVTSGQGQMWMRIDCEGDKRGFFDNMDSRPVKLKDWKAYEISGTVDQEAKEMVFGAFLVGDGKLWIDNFSLEVETGGKWTAIPVGNHSFEAENTAGWNTGSAGYSYMQVKDTKVEGQKALLIADISESKMLTTIFDDKPAFGEYFIKNIGNGLSCVVPLVLMGTDSTTYPVANAAQLQQLKDKIDQTVKPPMTANDLYVRFSAVAVAWNAFQHFFPYKEEAKLQWDKELPANLRAAYEATDKERFASVLRVMTEKLKDGHVRLNYGSQDYFSIPAGAVLAEGKIVISKVDDVKDPAEQLPLKAGDEVISIDGIAAMKRFADLKKEVSGSEQYKNAIAQSVLFNGNKDTEMLLKIKRSGEAEKAVRLVRKGYRNSRDTITIKKLKDGIYYVNIGNTEMKEITAMMPELAQAKGLVCDLRGYPKGNHELISHLLTVQDSNKWMFVPRITHPDYEKVSYEGMGWNMPVKTPHISAKVIFLTGGGSISYAESYMGFIKGYKLATIVGQPTAGANGNINPFNLPGGYNLSFTGMKVKLQDGGELHGLGIQPDVLVDQTIKGITEGRDEYLEKALELLK
ncbi:S41 family peptidase [Pedobacter frigoris]|uniref:Peptidase S41 n=1 Tax=Pedobacter frigoris TaxID=2571272 RepID=A0A4U1CQG4_9SPHI|nr:S41 family peptidase [Pedobacter frigoris]TKC09065.1 peptidase S41 [Pedobacter frigoris]